MPERELVCAVIETAILDARCEPSKFKALESRQKAAEAKRSAIKWLFSKNKRAQSFLWWCQLIDLDPNYIREQLKKSGVLPQGLKENVRCET